jgi:uncharacterized protein YciI
MADAQELEQEGRLEEAAAVYQQLVNADATDQKVVERLLVIYRRLKEYKKELAVIESALAAFAQRDKDSQQKWISEHPNAAKAGRAFLKTMGGSSVSAFGTDPMVGRLMKRKELVEKRVRGKAAGRKQGAAAKKKEGPGERGRVAGQEKKKAAAGARRKKVAEAKQAAAAKKKAEEAAKRAVAEAKRKEAATKREEAARARREAGEAKRKEAAEARRAAAEARREAAAAKKAAEEEARAHPPLFVISLRYLVPLEKIDAAMSKHTAFLNKHLATGDFLMSGQQVPRTGEIIIAKGKDRAAVERIMKRDPLSKLASADIVEFKPSPSKQGHSL